MIKLQQWVFWLIRFLCVSPEILENHFFIRTEFLYFVFMQEGLVDFNSNF